jgi:hypothetical protein
MRRRSRRDRRNLTRPPDSLDAVTDPQQQQDDLTADDRKVSQTDNGWHEGDGPQPVQTVEPTGPQVQS